MNKQEAIKEIEKLEGLNIKEKNLILDIEMISKGDVLEIIEQIDEPEKPVVPRCVADMIVKRKRAGQSVVKAIENLRFYEDACKWVRNNGETFVKAWLYGYEVEKKKLYTVKFANEDFGTIYIGVFKKFNKLGISSLSLNDDEVKSWFTKDELKRFKFWDNPAFEIKKVK